MPPGRRPISPRGRLFGSDVTFDVLVATSKRPDGFRASDLFDELGTTTETVSRELAKLASLNILEEAPEAGTDRDRPYRRGRSKLARRVRELPDLIEGEIADR